MSENDTEEPASTTGASDVPVDEPDGLLEIFSNIANGNSEISIGITINVPGGVVSGDIIGRDQWLQQLSEHEHLGPLMKPIAERVFTEHPAPRQRWRFLHLKNARVFPTASDPVPSFEVEGSLWRGRISEIAGWSFGTIGRQPSD